MENEKDLKRRIEEIRKKGETEGTPEAFFYGMLKSAHPSVVAVLEKEAAKFSFIGERLGREISEAENDPARKKEWLEMLGRVEQGFRDEALNLKEDTD